MKTTIRPALFLCLFFCFSTSVSALGLPGSGSSKSATNKIVSPSVNPETADLRERSEAWADKTTASNAFPMGAYADAFGRSRRTFMRANYREGSLWSTGSPFNSPFEFKPKTDFEVGDTVIVVVNENFSTREDLRMENESESDLKFKIEKLWNMELDRQLFGGMNGAVDYPETSINGTDEYEGQSRSRQRSNLTLEISCEVKKILPDGRLMIEGRHSRLIGRDRKVYVLTGMVQPDHVDPVEHTVPSTRVTESQIRWEGKGPGQDTLKPGLVNRILDYIPLF